MTGPSHTSPRSLLWGACGTIVVLYIFLAALERVDPSEAVPLTVGVLVLAVLWLAHEWRQLWLGESRDTRRRH